MKVLFVSSGNSRYGIVPFIKRQGESLIKEGVDVDFYPLKGKGIKGYLKNIKPLRSYIKKNGFDLIHAHYGLIGLVCGIAKPKKTPMVLSLMGSDAYGSFNIKGERLFSSYFEMFLTQIAMLFAKQIIAKSKNILKMVPWKNKTHIIPNGVDLNLFYPTTNKLEPNIILSLANPNDPRKNIKLAQEAIKILNHKNIKFINPFPIKPEEFPNYLNRSSLFLLTSYNEGSPNVIKEAMACNIPIVSTGVGDVKEVIRDTEGCYITSFDPEDVANKIKKALAFGKRTNGRQRILELGLDSKTIANKIIQVYESVLNE